MKTPSPKPQAQEKNQYSDPFDSAVSLLAAAKKFWAFYQDLAASNPGFMGKLTIQDYERYNRALIELPAAIARCDARLTSKPNLVLRCFRGGRYHFQTGGGGWTTNPAKAMRYTLAHAREAKGRSRSLIIHESKMMSEGPS